MAADIEDDYEVHGYFEDIICRNGETVRLLGTRSIPKPEGRLLGQAGRIDYCFTEPLRLKRGHREVVIKASLKHPFVCWGHAQAVCGRMKARR